MPSLIGKSLAYARKELEAEGYQCQNPGHPNPGRYTLLVVPPEPDIDPEYPYPRHARELGYELRRFTEIGGLYDEVSTLSCGGYYTAMAPYDNGEWIPDVVGMEMPIGGGPGDCEYPAGNASTEGATRAANIAENR